jgi:hypothetical protein
LRLRRLFRCLLWCLSCLRIPRPHLRNLRRHPLQLFLSGHQVVLGLVSRVSSRHKSAADSCTHALTFYPYRPSGALFSTRPQDRHKPPPRPTGIAETALTPSAINAKSTPPALIAPDSYREWAEHPNQSSTFVSTNAFQTPTNPPAPFPAPLPHHHPKPQYPSSIQHLSNGTLRAPQRVVEVG